MPFIAAFGYEVDDEVWLSELTDFNICLQKASARSHDCAFGCAAKFDSAAEASAGVLCVAGCLAHGFAQKATCERQFPANLGFHGKPKDDKDPGEFFKNFLKTQFADTEKVLVTLGTLSFGWGSFKVHQSLKAAEVAKAALQSRGSLLILIGGGMLGANQIMDELVDDPPDDEFDQVFQLRQFNVQELLSPLSLDPDIALPFLSLLNETLQVLTCMEGIAVSMNRAAAAFDAGNTQKQLAQMRVSQRYAKACSEEVKRAQDTRLELADKLDTLSIAEGSPDVGSGNSGRSIPEILAGGADASGKVASSMPRCRVRIDGPSRVSIRPRSRIRSTIA